MIDGKFCCCSSNIVGAYVVGDLSLILRIIIIIASTAYLKAKLINYALRSF
jgi:hypothetical protein